MEITYRPIGTIHSEFKNIAGMPVQPSGAAGIQGTIEIFSEFAEGLMDLDGFSHIVLLYHFHLSKPGKLTVMPFLDTKPHGIFATRTPVRPNTIGMSVVKLLRVEQNILHVENIDVLDNTPLLDIKPYVPEFDHPNVERVGWLEHARGKVVTKRSDDRFGQEEKKL